MPDIVLVAIVTGLFSVASAFIAAIATGNRNSAEMRVNQAVTDTKIDALASEVREHNNFARRIPILETKLEGIESRVKTLEKKVS